MKNKHLCSKRSPPVIQRTSSKKGKKEKKLKCCLCDSSTAMRGNALQSERSTNCQHIQCSRCNRYSCSMCLEKIVTAIPKPQYDLWCEEVQSFLLTGSHPDQFVGHCCEHQFQRKQVKKHIHTSQTKLCDGDLCLIEFGLLIKTSFKTVDVHALASDGGNKSEGAWHCVIPMKDAISFANRNLYPKKFDATKTQNVSITIPLPWAQETNEYFKIEIVEVDQVIDFDSNRKGTNQISDVEFSNMSRYCGETKSSETDVTILTGRWSADSPTRVLLLMRFHKMNPMDSMTNAKTQMLYTELSKQMGKHGFEDKRVGGSSGMIETSQEMMKYIHPSQRHFPRYYKSIKFLKAKNGLKWECFYIGTKDLKPKKTFMCNIRKGGAFSMPHEMMSSFPFLQDFLATKAKAALLLNEINLSNRGFVIQPNAVAQELDNLKRANELDIKFLMDQLTDIDPKRVEKKKAYVMKHFATQG